jgi:hypothetical protein
MCKLDINYIKNYTIRDLAPNRGSTEAIFPFHFICLIVTAIAVTSVFCFVILILTSVYDTHIYPYCCESR